MEHLLKIIADQFREPTVHGDSRALMRTRMRGGHALEALYTARRIWDLAVHSLGPGAFSDRIVMPQPRRTMSSQLT